MIQRKIAKGSDPTGANGDPSRNALGPPWPANGAKRAPTTPCDELLTSPERPRLGEAESAYAGESGSGGDLSPSARDSAPTSFRWDTLGLRRAVERRASSRLSAAGHPALAYPNGVPCAGYAGGATAWDGSRGAPIRQCPNHPPLGRHRLRCLAPALMTGWSPGRPSRRRGRPPSPAARRCRSEALKRGGRHRDDLQSGSRSAQRGPWRLRQARRSRAVGPAGDRSSGARRVSHHEEDNRRLQCRSSAGRSSPDRRPRPSPEPTLGRR